MACWCGGSESWLTSATEELAMLGIGEWMRGEKRERGEGTVLGEETRRQLAKRAAERLGWAI